MFRVEQASNSTGDGGSYYYSDDLNNVTKEWPQVFGFYVAYFIGFCIVAAIVDGSRVFDGFVAKLSHSAYSTFRACEKIKEVKGADPQISEARVNEIRHDHSEQDAVYVEEGGSCLRNCCCCCCCCSGNKVHHTRESFSAGFLNDLLNTQSCFFGCQDVYHKGGFTIGFWKCKLYTFPAGMMVRNCLLIYNCIDNCCIGGLVFVSTQSSFLVECGHVHERQSIF